MIRSTRTHANSRSLGASPACIVAAFVAIVLAACAAVPAAAPTKAGGTAAGHPAEGKLESFLGAQKLDIQLRSRCIDSMSKRVAHPTDSNLPVALPGQSTHRQHMLVHSLAFPTRPVARYTDPSCLATKINSSGGLYLANS